MEEGKGRKWCPDAKHRRIRANFFSFFSVVISNACGICYAYGRSLQKKGTNVVFHEEWQEGYRGKGGDDIHSPSVYAKKIRRNKQTVLVCVLFAQVVLGLSLSLSLSPCLLPPFEHTPSFASPLFLSLRWTGTGTCHAMPYQLFLLLLVYMLLYLLARCKIKKRGENNTLTQREGGNENRRAKRQRRREGLTCL